LEWFFLNVIHFDQTLEGIDAEDYPSTAKILSEGVGD
jgi:hypothetical protein